MSRAIEVRDIRTSTIGDWPYILLGARVAAGPRESVS